MRRGLLVLAMLGWIALVGLGEAQEAPQGPNLLAGHEVTVVMPDGVLVLEAGRAGWTWTGPAVLEIDGRPSAKIILPTASVAEPPRPTWPYWLAGAAGFALGGWAGISLAHALK